MGAMAAKAMRPGRPADMMAGTEATTAGVAAMGAIPAGLRMVTAMIPCLIRGQNPARVKAGTTISAGDGRPG